MFDNKIVITPFLELRIEGWVVLITTVLQSLMEMLYILSLKNCDEQKDVEHFISIINQRSLVAYLVIMCVSRKISIPTLREVVGNSKTEGGLNSQTF